MKKLFVNRALLIFLFLVSMVLIAGCAKKEEEGKILVTTASEEAKQHFIEGRNLFEKLRAQNSLQHFENAIAKDNNFALAYYYHALANPTTKGFFEDLEKATALADKVSDGEKLMIQAFKAGADGDQKKQEEYLLKLIQLYPTDERAHNLLGQFYFGQQDFNKAVEHLSKAAEIAPTFSLSYNMLGYSNRNLEKFDEAEKAFKKYIELIPDDPNPYDSYAELLMKMGKYEQSIEQYRKALAVDPNFVASFIGIADNYNFLGKYEYGRKELQALYDKARNDGEKRAALFAMTVSYTDEGNFDKALEEMQKQYDLGAAINDAGAMAGDLNTMGNILFEAGKYDEAMKKYSESLEVTLASNLSNEVKENTKRFNLYNEGRVLLMKNDLKAAKAKASEFSEKAKASNNTFQIWLSHELNGCIALKEKDFTKAESELKMANQQNPYTYYRLGLVYQGMNDKVKADEHFKKAANFNALTNMNQSFVRVKTRNMMTSSM
ncbi:MAG: tetratricopeptide repeat protein [Ignavibacteriaceae bacterium]|nr:tetratricopeptide repeat protein [Ignavibacteriaceae bacterium]